MKDGGDRVPHSSFVAPGKSNRKKELLRELHVLRDLFRALS